MKQLILVRHAKSSWDDASMSDFERPLNHRGKKDAGDMALRLQSRIASIDAFITSPAKRAAATAEKFAAAFDAKKKLVLEPGLYLAPPEFFQQLLARTSNEFNTIAVFAHNPGITGFANSLQAGVQTDNIPTCGIFAVASTANNWAGFTAASLKLLFYDYPKLGH